MAGPPKNVSPSDLWQKITERPRPTIDVDFPRKGVDGEPVGRLKLWILTESELHWCRANAEKTAREYLRDPEDPKAVADRTGYGFQDIYYEELNIQLVSQAARDVQDPKFPAFPSAKHARQALTTDEFAVLVRSYSAFKLESGPIVAEMTPAEMDLWIKKLMDGGSAVPLAHLSSEALQTLLRHSVSLLTKSRTDNGSHGSPQESSSMEMAPAVASDLVDPNEVNPD